ncbi:hypothetical protein [Rhizobium rosettiformans]|uniref:hypothetical protein n=1 Tax=Rhizobium rosettiformans TaxID=1368430 RepID=UPI002859EA8D|nr:hypothetical protein [Rhizobium rosettiformans]MDR7031283.1 hypothetical protein [Rhizobium rosettiformans]MDR7067150.1 hypothetical protein [Rhizobium rosettiformans]
MGTPNDDLAKACIALIDRTETLSKQVLALINLNALLFREVSLAHEEPLQHFGSLEAELGGLGEAIALGARKYEDVQVSSQAITEVYEQVLRQGRDLLEACPQLYPEKP